MNGIPPAGPLELLHKDEGSARLQRCNNAETLPAQELRPFLRRPAESARHLGCFVTKATKIARTHVDTHTHTQTKQKKREGASAQTPTTRHKHFRTHGHMRPRWSRGAPLSHLFARPGEASRPSPAQLDNNNGDVREHTPPGRNSLGNYSNG